MRKSVKRFDNGRMYGVTKTPEGFLKGTARVTRTGIFMYKNADGSTLRELRHPDDVFDSESLNSLKMLPITNLHPKGKMVTADTAKELSIGFTGENIIPDGKYLVAPIAITTKEGVKSVEDGRQELSLGYEVELDDTPGEYCGERFDCRQTNIRYNHLAIVDRARAGAEARLNLDGEDAIEVEDSSESNSLHTQTGSSDMPKLRLDNGIEYEVQPEVVAAFRELTAKNDSNVENTKKVQSALDSLSGERDGLKDQVTKLKKELDEMPVKIKNDMKARTSLEEKAAKFLSAEVVGKFDSMDDAAIMKAVVLAKFPEAKFDGKGKEYIAARFDTIVEADINDGEDGEDGMASQRAKVLSRKDSSDTVNADGCRSKMIDRMKNAHKEEKE
jgi:uncharacterized protein